MYINELKLKAPAAQATEVSNASSARNLRAMAIKILVKYKIYAEKSRDVRLFTFYDISAIVVNIRRSHVEVEAEISTLSFIAAPDLARWVLSEARPSCTGSN